MRIAHICLAQFYIDGFGYQENILPRVHRRMGHDVEIITSTETYIDQTRLGYVAPASYVNEDGIPVHRLPYARWVPRKIQPKIRAYRGLKQSLETFRPDLIFLHDLQFWDLLVVRKYALAHNIPVHADSHTDFVNSARGFVSRHLLHGGFYRPLLRYADPMIRRYFPTLPARADFMHEVYGLSRAKMELLPFGFDDTSVAGLDRDAVRREIRENLGISKSDLVLVTGGKLDLRKNIHVLIERFSALRRAGQLGAVHLVVFGKPNPEVVAELAKLDMDENVHLIGWMDPKILYRVFWAADAAIFPGTHSVSWEEAIGHGLASVFHRWNGMEHLDLGGNTLFMDDATATTLDRVLLDLTKDNGAQIRRMADIAQTKGPRVFSFSQIAQKAIA